MSSHHIVRDEQEPALYIHAADNFLLAALGDLLEWSPTVICSEEALQKVVDYGTKVDAIPHMPESTDLDAILRSQAPIRVMPFDPGKIAELFDVLASENYKGLNIATTKGKHEELLADVSSYRGPMDCTVYTPAHRIVRIRHAPFQKWLAVGHYAILGQGQTFDTRGFDADVSSDHSPQIAMEKSTAGLVRIDCSEPPFWFIEEL